MIWASAGLSLRTGRKARDQRMVLRCRVASHEAQPDLRQTTIVATPTQEGHKSNLHQIRDVTAVRHKPTSCRPNKLALGSGSGAARRCKRCTCWGRTACSLGTLDATHPRGLTSNRHAGRPDRWSIRAFAFSAIVPTFPGLGGSARPERPDFAVVSAWLRPIMSRSAAALERG